MGQLRKFFSASGAAGGGSGRPQPLPAAVENKIKQCSKLSKKANSTFHFAFLFLPRYQRRALHVIYLFCRKVDDAVDEPGSIAEKNKRLDKLEQDLKESPNSPPLWPALNWVRENFDIPIKYFKDLIKGARSDVGKVRIQSTENLDEYCYRVAGTVGLMTLKVLKAPVKKLQPEALKLARAFQITNILRDIEEDFQRDRCYLPLDLLKKNDAFSAWKNRRRNPGLIRVCTILAERAEKNYREAVNLLERVSGRQRLTLAFMSGAYSYYLAVLKKDDFLAREKKITMKKTKLPRLIFDSFRALVGDPEKCLQIS